MSIRPATRNDGSHMAVLVDIAGRGLPAFVWDNARKPGQSILEIGRARAMRDKGDFSWRNTYMLEENGAVAAMIVCFRLADPYEAGDLSALLPQIRPIVELESMVPGSLYINVLAVYPEHRSRGLGAQLLSRAEDLATQAGANRTSLVYSSANRRGQSFYERAGYYEHARRYCPPFPGSDPSNDVVLMVKDLQ